MTIRTYTAPTMAQALLKVKQDLGSCAVVLHTRTYKQGGVFGIGARTVVEVSAADGQQIGRKKAASRKAERQDAIDRINQHKTRQRPAEPERVAEVPAAAMPIRSQSHVQPPVRSSIQPQPMAGELIKQTYRAAMAGVQQETPPPAKQSTAQPTLMPPNAQAVREGVASQVIQKSVSPDTKALSNEMAEVKRLVARLMEQGKNASGATENAADLPDNLFDQYQKLIEQELSQELASEAIQNAQSVLTDEQLGDDRVCQQAVRRATANLLKAQATPAQQSQSEDQSPASGGGPRVIALVGPTGVGKTTTVAKLAATHKLRFGHHVGLITLDTYRIAAVEQLKVYAKIIGLPLHVVTSGEELSRSIRMLAGCDVILIDTAGRSPKNAERLDELAEMMAVAKPDETHLVLSATFSERAMRATAEQFERVCPDHLIYTKLDEADSYGTLLTVARTLGKRVSYLTTGQEVPHQIEPCRSDRLAQLVMDGCLENPAGRDGIADSHGAEWRARASTPRLAGSDTVGSETDRTNNVNNTPPETAGAIGQKWTVSEDSPQRLQPAPQPAPQPAVTKATAASSAPMPAMLSTPRSTQATSASSVPKARSLCQSPTKSPTKSSTKTPAKTSTSETTRGSLTTP